MKNFPNDFTALPDGWHVETTPTIGLRDYFAATVLPVIYAKSGDSWDGIARDAYRMADAMLKAKEAR